MTIWFKVDDKDIASQYYNVDTVGENLGGGNPTTYGGALFGTHRQSKVDLEALQTDITSLVIYETYPSEIVVQQDLET